MSIRNICCSLISAWLSVGISFAAFADDLEIYLGVADSQATYNPNVLFIMDTSGSMGAKDGGSESRMLRVQNALKEVLATATNVNAGLMRFSDYGGPIIYPVTDIDQVVAPELIIGLADTNDDADEVSGYVDASDNDVRLSFGTTTVHSGFRFQAAQIPQGATITSAYLKFVSNQSNIAATTIDIYGELVPDASAYADGGGLISARTKTATSVSWNTANEFPVSGEEVSSIDISPVIQEVVNQADWCGGNALGMILEGSSADAASGREVMSADEGSGSSVQLIVEYDHSTATGCIQGNHTYQISATSNNAEEKSNGYQSTGTELTFKPSSNSFIGLRFEDINIPRDATISSAYIEFTAYRNRSTSGSGFTISAANEPNPSSFSSYPRYLLRDKAKTAGVSWTNIPSWSKNSTYQSPDISSVVQAIVNRSDWVTGNALMLIMSNITGNRGAYTYKGKPSGAPRLVVEFEGNADPTSAATVRSHLINKVDELSANGYTPIVDTLFEAASYYGGNEVYYGLARGNSSASSSVRRSTRVSNRLSYDGLDSVLPSGCTTDNLNDNDCISEYIPTGATYISPIVDLQCQTNNHIVLLSDGQANNNHSVDEIQALLGTTCTGSGGEKCGLNLVSNIRDTSDSAIGAKVTTHTIGFAANATANNFLNQLALQGGGGFYTADNSDDLVEAFQTIIRSVKDVNATFVSPGVAVNQLNRLTHRDELYFALFKPAEGTDWPGNLKKYKLSSDVILDKNGLPAINSSTGFFDENSHSYWSTLADGNDVREGGAAGNLDLVRDIYFFEGSGTIVSNGNRLHEDNSNITTTNMAVDSEADPAARREEVLQWARGVDIKDEDGDGSFTDVRTQMGDPIHSQPVIVNYSATDSAVMVATNHGFLHSIDPETGEENFAIIPKELLANLNDIYEDASSYTHIYGLDGDLVLRTTDSSTYLYVGMRRGGNNYYAFDVTSKNSPSVLFTIDGGAGDFANLGQTWSRPTVTKVKIGASVKDVLIFGGGYDEDQDSKETRSADTVGNSVFIVDADTGALLWSASDSGADLNLSEMIYSIPARISTVDRDSDGLADHLYVADTGGQIFRLDIHNGESGADFITGGVLASLGGDSAADNRRFYYGPDIGEISLADEHYYAVAVGSGYRAHPLNAVIQDRFYMIKDTGVFIIDEDGNYDMPAVAYTETELYDASAHLLTTPDQEAREIEVNEFAEKNGWYIQLGTGGEKVLASPLILNYRLFFTTYLPSTASDSACAAPTGTSRAYLVELVNGNAVTDLDNDGILEHEDRYADLTQTGISPDTKILIEDIVKPVVCLGTECTAIVEDGESCGSEFECLAEKLYGEYERLIRSSWKTETERQ
ncbi:MAG: PilC/PilY family type IV pilus protein [Aestuariibacter sp.]